jgi:hypothetical protein
MWHLIQHWLAYMTGSLNTSGAPPNYNFFSGFGSDLGEVTIVAALATMYKKHSCHQRWCWRFAHYDLTSPDGSIAYRLCRAHHPAHPGRRQLTRHHVARIHGQNTPPPGDGSVGERLYNQDRDGERGVQ